MSRWLAAVCCAWTLACSFVPKPGLRHPDRPTVADHRTRATSVRVEIESRKRTLDGALRSGNMAAAANVFAEHAVLVYMGDTLYGRAATQRWLEERLPGGTGSVWTEREQLMLCTDGVYETHGTLTLIPIGTPGSPAVSAVYAMRWDNAATDSLMIRYLSFDASSAMPRRRPADCPKPRPYVPVAELRRTQVAVSVPLRSSAGNDIVVMLASNGWDEHPRPPTQRNSHSVQLNASHRLRASLVAGANIASARSHAIGFDRRATGNSYLTVDRESQSASLTLGWQFRNVRFAAGPGLLRQDWFILDEYRVDAGNWLLIQEWSRQRTDETKAGMHVEGIYAYPIGTNRIFLEARVQGARFASSTLSGEAFANPVKVKNQGWSAGVSLGVGF